jgi:DNA-directed RNA polymerase specialized sigma24 family protein
MHKDDFEEFLSRFEADALSYEARYKRLRKKLSKFFAWRYTTDPEGLADETIARLVNKLTSGEGSSIIKPYAYVYTIAHHVFQEYQRDQTKREKITVELIHQDSQVINDGFDCQKYCFNALAPENRDLLENYYADDESKQALAENLEITLNALRILIFRLKRDLKKCRKKCLADASGGK